MLVQAGWRIERIFDHFPNADRERIEDVEWIPYASARGWAILLKDSGVLANEAERDTIINCEARLFCLNRKSLPARVAADRFLKHQQRIWHASERVPGPFFYSVRDAGLARKL